MAPLGDEIVQTFIDVVKDILIDGVTPYLLAFPMDTVPDDMFGDEYGVWPTKYIGDIDGVVLLSKTLKGSGKFKNQNSNKLI